jgi:hypothetical protein
VTLGNRAAKYRLIDSCPRQAAGNFGDRENSPAANPRNTFACANGDTAASRCAHSHPTTIAAHRCTPTPCRRHTHTQFRVATSNHRSDLLAAAGLSCHTTHSGSK